MEKVFAMYDLEDDFDEEAFKVFYETHASEDLKQMDREMKEYFAKRLLGLH